MPELSQDLLQQLVDLIDRLRLESEAFLEKPGDQQQWYNRGYANGMVQALFELGQQSKLADRVPDAGDELDAQLTLAWGKAYRHGEESGRREIYEITGNTMP